MSLNLTGSSNAFLDADGHRDLLHDLVHRPLRRFAIWRAFATRGGRVRSGHRSWRACRAETLEKGALDNGASDARLRSDRHRRADELKLVFGVPRVAL